MDTRVVLAWGAGVLAIAVCAQAQVSLPTINDAQPGGALSGKIVYLHGGHGWTANNLGSGAWFTQRPETFEIVEDLLNQDLMRFQADALWNAGATVVPLRPIGHQPIEVIVDNDDAGATFSGPWSDSNQAQFFGDPGDVPYRFANTSAVETAVARYTPDLPEAGFYPVYTWALLSGNRVEQLYRVTHTGGTTELRIDHRRVGSGLVYLGTYHFDAGTAGFVEISNQSGTPGVVIADAIRFGNGMGDIDRGGGISGETREDEAALYWIQAQLGQGTPTSAYRVSSDDGTASVGAPTRWAEHMNNSAVGTLSDRVFLSHHSNAAGGTARGVIALVNGNNVPSTATPNQFLLAITLANEINVDMPVLDERFEHPWGVRTGLIFDAPTFEYGEINNSIINNEFDATIVERGFHDNQTDAELLRDAKVNEAVARSTVRGLVRYFNAVDGGATPIVFTPGRVAGVRTESEVGGLVTVAWDAPPSGLALGDAPLGYRVRTSRDGLGFDAGVIVPFSTTSVTFEGLDPAEGAVFFRVHAINPGGEGPGSSVAAALPPADAGAERVLIVDGFDRLDRRQNVRAPYLSGTIDRVRVRSSNSRDYAVQVARALEAFGGLAFDTTANESLITGDVLLDDADAAVWILGEESTGDRTFDADEQLLADAFVLGGGDLIVSGAEVGWDLAANGNGVLFFNETLGADLLRDDAATYAVAGAPGGPLAGLVFTFDDGSVFYDAEFPDQLGAIGGSVELLRYAGGFGGAAGVGRVGTGGAGDTAVLGFPFETILGEQTRADVMAGLLAFVGVGAADDCPADLSPAGGDGTLDFFDVLAFLAAFDAQDPSADLDVSGSFDFFDVLEYLALFDAGC
ncbi:MAG: GC-type dockerin domain-anchored protein [Planctomycetota bacterium]